METENGIEVHISENAYENLAVIGLIEKIKLDLLTRPDLPVHDLRKRDKSQSQKYDA
jgi:hypothetical protein